MQCFSHVGFQLDGRLREAKYRDGKYVDLLVYSILYDDLERAQTSQLLYVSVDLVDNASACWSRL